MVDRELPSGYSVRDADERDATFLAACRTNMLRELDGESADTTAQAERDLARWMADRLASGVLAGWVVSAGESPVAGAVGMTYELLPMHRAPNGRLGRLMGLFVEPEHRRRGVARAIVLRALESFRERGVLVVRLGASDEGKELYASLGFEEFPEMGIVLSSGEE